METFTNILVVSRSTKYCIKVLRTGIALARKFDAKLHVLHVIHDPFLVVPAPYQDEEYRAMMAKTHDELAHMIQFEKAEGLVLNEWVKEGDPVVAIRHAVEEVSIDLILMLARKEGRLEHLLFGKTNEKLIRKLPASIMLVAN